jgi:NAD/NADP transhydrogenase alpha subunit
MNFVTRTFRTLGRTVRGAVTATAEVPTAALVVSTIGMFGLIDWPIVVGVSAGAMVLQRFVRSTDDSPRDAQAPHAQVAGKASNGSASPKTSGKAPRKVSSSRAGTTA